MLATGLLKEKTQEILLPWGTLGEGSHRIQTHFGEILQGEFILEGKRRRALVTLPCPTFTSMAVFSPQLFSPLTVTPDTCHKSLQAARMTLAYLGCENIGGELVIDSDIPHCIGGGSSSGDVVATIRAVAQAVGRFLSDDDVALLAVRSETATDSIMFEDGQAVLFAHREGIALEKLGALPKLLAVGITDGDGVDTLSYTPANYSDHEVDRLTVLLDKLRTSIRSGKAAGVAHVATESAILNQKFLPKPHFGRLINLAEKCGASGVSVSHSGSAFAFLYDTSLPNTEDNIVRLKEQLRFITSATMTFHAVSPVRSLPHFRKANIQ